VGFTTSIFSASYIAHELETGRLTPDLPAFLPRHVPDHDVGMNLAFVSTISA